MTDSAFTCRNAIAGEAEIILNNEEILLLKNLLTEKLPPRVTDEEAVKFFGDKIKVRHAQDLANQLFVAFRITQ